MNRITAARKLATDIMVAVQGMPQHHRAEVRRVYSGELGLAGAILDRWVTGVSADGLDALQDLADALVRPSMEEGRQQADSVALGDIFLVTDPRTQETYRIRMIGRNSFCEIVAEAMEGPLADQNILVNLFWGEWNAVSV